MTLHFRRARILDRTWLTAVATLLAALVSMSGRGAMAASTCNTTTTSSYSVQLCLNQPDAGSVVSGNVSVSASATILSGSGRVARFVYTIDGAYTLTDFMRPRTSSCQPRTGSMELTTFRCRRS